MTVPLRRRSFLTGLGALVVGFSLPRQAGAQAVAATGKTLDATAVDGYIAVNADGTVTLYCGKVDLGTGLRAAIPQMAAEELGLPLDRIRLIEGDTKLTPDQGSTSGSTGIMRGGVQIRQAAATARAGLLKLAADRLGRPAAELAITDGVIAPLAGGAGVSFAELIAGKSFDLKLDPKAPLRSPASYTIVGTSAPRPDVPAKLTGTHPYIHDFELPGMLHGRIIRPPTPGGMLVSVDEASVAAIPGAKVLRQKDFLGVVAADEWDAVQASRALKTVWKDGPPLPRHETLGEDMRKGPFTGDEVVEKKGDIAAGMAAGARRLSAHFYWPMQSHGSMGPACVVADVKADSATIWSPSQATHRYAAAYASLIGLKPDQVRVIYLDGAGCYGMNGHEDCGADATLMSKLAGAPVRLQWSREDELGWDPKGPPQAIGLEAALDSDGRITGWKADLWIAKSTPGLPHNQLLAHDAAGVPQKPGIATGLMSQNAAPYYDLPNVSVTAHWLPDTPLRTSNLRAPGKVANTFAVETFIDELALLAGKDPLDYRLSMLKDPRGLEVLKRAAALLKWERRVEPRKDGRGRGIGYVHYKGSESYVAMGMEVIVDKASGAIRVTRVTCGHDCGLMINPDGVKAQVEGQIFQTLSRTLFEEVKMDGRRVTSVDWESYPILTFPDAPAVEIDLVQQLSLPPLGAGEAACAPVPAALANAVFDATGVRLRIAPFTAHRVKQAALEGPKAG